MGSQKSQTRLSERAHTDADSTPDPLIGLQSRRTLASRLEISVRKEKDFTASDHRCATSLFYFTVSIVQQKTTRATRMFRMTSMNKAWEADDPSCWNQNCPDHLWGNLSHSKCSTNNPVAKEGNQASQMLARCLGRVR